MRGLTPTFPAPVDLADGAMNMHAMQRTILIADDDPHIRQLLSFALTKAGLGAREAEDGEQALAMILADPPDLVILDINMPRLDGLEVCRRLRARSDVPILFLSSRDDEIDRVLGIEMGGDDYVTKPFSPREVVARVTAILRRATARGEAPKLPTVPTRGRLTVDTEAWTARWGDQEVALTVGGRARPGVQPRDHHRPSARARLRRHRPHHRQPCAQPAREVRPTGGSRRRRDPAGCRLSPGPLPRGPRVSIE